MLAPALFVWLVLRVPLLVPLLVLPLLVPLLVLPLLVPMLVVVVVLAVLVVVLVVLMLVRVPLLVLLLLAAPSLMHVPSLPTLPCRLPPEEFFAGGRCRWQLPAQRFLVAVSHPSGFHVQVVSIGRALLVKARYRPNHHPHSIAKQGGQPRLAAAGRGRGQDGFSRFRSFIVSLMRD